MYLNMRHTFVLAGLVLLPATSVSIDQPEPARVDPRLTLLRTFFLQRDAPIVHLAEDFLRAADQHGLDWRLLPSIAMVESSGAKHYRNNNIFGWNNGRVRFRSIHSSIYEMALSMSSMRCYRGKSLDGVLWTYNPIPGYNTRIKNEMRAIDPDFRTTQQVMMPAGGGVFPPNLLTN